MQHEPADFAAKLYFASHCLMWDLQGFTVQLINYPSPLSGVSASRKKKYCQNTGRCVLLSSARRGSMKSCTCSHEEGEECLTDKCVWSFVFDLSSYWLCVRACVRALGVRRGFGSFFGFGGFCSSFFSHLALCHAVSQHQSPWASSFRSMFRSQNISLSTTI